MDSLIRYSLELVWSINKLLTDLVCELKYSDEVAYTEAKAHRDPEQSVVIAAKGKSAKEVVASKMVNILSP